MTLKAWCNIEEVPYRFSWSSIKFQGHTVWKIDDLNPIWVRLLGRSQLSNPSDLPCIRQEHHNRGMIMSSKWLLDCMWQMLKFAMSLHQIILFSCDQAALWMVFSVCLSVRPSVCPSHLFDYVPIMVSSWNFQELSPRTRVTSMQKVKVRCQRSRSQRSQPNLAVSGL